MKTFLKLVVLVALVAAGVYGYRKYAEYSEKKADAEARLELKEFFRLAGDGNPDAAAIEGLRALVVKMEETSRKCGEDMRDSLFIRRLDGAFMVGDYAKAEQLMDQFGEKSENWREGAKAKIRAHAALDSGDKATAIKEFSVFIERMRAEPEDSNEVDPCTGAEWTKEMIIARNLKRISELAADIGNAADAAKFRAEAVEALKAAVEKATGNPEMLETIKKDAGDLLKGVPLPTPPAPPAVPAPQVEATAEG